MVCLDCLGSGCPVCAGDGYITITGKPLGNVTARGFHLFRMYRWMKNYSIFPLGGGLLNQSAKLIRAFEFMDMVNQIAAKTAKDFKTEKAKEIETMATAFNTKKRK